MWRPFSERRSSSLACLPFCCVLSLLTIGAPLAGQGSIPAHTAAVTVPVGGTPQVIVLRLEVRVRDLTLGLIEALHLEEFIDPAISTVSQNVVLLDVAALARLLEYTPEQVRDFCSRLKRQAGNRQLKRVWPCHATADQAASVLAVPLEIDVANAAIVARGDAQLPVLRRALLRRSALTVVPSAWSGPSNREPAHHSMPVPAADADIRLVRQRAITQVDYQLHWQRHARHLLPFDRSNRHIGDEAAWSGVGNVQLRRGLFGGALAVDLAGGSGMAPESRWQWTFRDATLGRPMRSWQVGAVSSNGPVPREIWGLAFGLPMEEVHSRRDVLVSHRAQPAWDYVALVGDRVMAGELTADGRVQFRVPIVGEASSYQLVTLAPDGREQREWRLAHGLPAMGAGGRVRHRSSVGRCRTIAPAQYTLVASGGQPCQWHASTDWRWQLHDRAELQAGTEWADGRVTPFAGLRTTPHPSWVLAGSAQRSTNRRVVEDGDAPTVASSSEPVQGNVSLLWQPSPVRQVQAEWLRSSVQDVRRLHWMQALPGPARGLLLGAWWSESRMGASVVSLGRLNISSTRGGARLEIFAQHVGARSSSGRMEAQGQPPSRQTQFGTGTQFTPRWQRPGDRPWWVRASVARDAMPSIGAWQHDLRVNTTLAGADIEVAQTGSATGWRWSVLVAPRTLRTRMATSLSGPLRAPNARSGGSPARTAGSQVQGLSAAGGIALDGGRWRLAAERTADLAAVESRVFLDLNGNGVMDASDRPLGDVLVTSGSQRRTSDAVGRVLMSGLTGREPVELTVDLASLEQPCWVSAHATRRVQLATAHVRLVDLPIRYGVLIEGHVLRGDSSGATTAPDRLTLLSASGTHHVVDVMPDGWFSTPALMPELWTAMLHDGLDSARVVLDLRTESGESPPGAPSPLSASCRPRQLTLRFP